VEVERVKYIIKLDYYGMERYYKLTINQTMIPCKGIEDARKFVTFDSAGSIAKMCVNVPYEIIKLDDTE
jgi:hypothetical protein